jgi:hypothetical protein
MLLLPQVPKKSIQVEPSLEAYRVQCPDPYVRSMVLLVRGDGDETQTRWWFSPTLVFGQKRGCK